MTESGPSELARARWCILAAALLWSTGGVITKSLDLPAAAIAFYRSLFAGLVLLPLVPRERWVLRPAMIPVALAFGAMIGLYIAAVKATTAANAILLQCTSTFWLVPASVLILREPLDRRSVLGVGLAMLGIFAIVLNGYDGRPNEGRGVAFALASGVMYATVILSLRGLRRLDPIWLSAVNNLGGALTLGAWMLATQGTIARPSSQELVFLLGFGVIQMAIPYALFARGLRSLGAPEAGLIGLLEPVLNPLWVYLVRGERPVPATWFGGVLLLAGVAIRYLPARLLPSRNAA